MNSFSICQLIRSTDRRNNKQEFKMVIMESKIVYFEDIGPENTETTFGLVLERLEALGIKKLVLASTTGATAKKALEFFKDASVKLIVVPHQHDFHRDKNAIPQELVKSLRESGHDVHFGTMLFHTDGLYESTTPTVMANLLRCFCQGMKVCFESSSWSRTRDWLQAAKRLLP